MRNWDKKGTEEKMREKRGKKEKRNGEQRREKERTKRREEEKRKGEQRRGKKRRK